ncbi:hypothetical protein [Stenoxybacter acetivorans]|uniref:hypothetical protein n=1 Tax=Stenoxybacter acetivorans TaxID=422441 RepID=UPI00068D847D|nr:hypothetical protein [Stenoxybacter acetivorans]
MNIQDLSQYTLLMQASYAYLDKFKDESGSYKEGEVQAALRGEKKGDFAEKQAENFVKNYEVISHQPNQTSGFSATIFRDKESGENIFSIRGTEPNISWKNWINKDEPVFDPDIQADIGDIGFNGIALEQAVDMFNYYQRVTAVKGQKILQLKCEESWLAWLSVIPGPVGMLGKFADWMLETVTSEEVIATETGELANQEFTVVGHSLGGHLATILSRIAGSQAKAVYTVNAPGFDTDFVPLSDQTEAFFGNIQAMLVNAGLPVHMDSYFEADKMTHMVTKSNEANDVISMIGTIPGEQSGNLCRCPR